MVFGIFRERALLSPLPRRGGGGWGENSPKTFSRFEPLNRRIALAEAEARQRLGVRQPSGALEVVGGRKRQRAGALQDLSAVRTVHG